MKTNSNLKNAMKNFGLALWAGIFLLLIVKYTNSLPNHRIPSRPHPIAYDYENLPQNQWPKPIKYYDGDEFIGYMTYQEVLDYQGIDYDIETDTWGDKKDIDTNRKL